MLAKTRCYLAAAVDKEGDLDTDERTLDTDESNWDTDEGNRETEDSQHFQQAEAASPNPTIDSKGGLWKAGLGGVCVY